MGRCSYAHVSYQFAVLRSCYDSLFGAIPIVLWFWFFGHDHDQARGCGPSEVVRVVDFVPVMPGRLGVPKLPEVEAVYTVTKVWYWVVLCRSCPSGRLRLPESECVSKRRQDSLTPETVTEVLLDPSRIKDRASNWSVF